MRDIGVCYILDSFPNLSETFIIDEIFSVMEHGIGCCVVSMHKPNINKMHNRAIHILNNAQVYYYKDTGRIKKLSALVYNYFLRPLRTTKAIWLLMKERRNIWIAGEALAILLDIRNSNIKHFHAHYADKASHIALWLSKLMGVPFTFTTHGYDIFMNPPVDMNTLVLHSQRMLTISEYNKNYIAKEFSVKRERIKVIHCGVFTDKMPFKDINNYNFIKHVNILTVARLVPEKGLSYLISAMNILKHDGIDIKLRLIGEGPERGMLMEMIHSLGLDDIVSLPGACEHDVVIDNLLEADCFILPSLSEGIPIVLMEALATGVPSIATNINGIPELIIDGITGLLCEPGNSREIANAVKKLRMDRCLRDRLVRKGRDKVVKEFDRTMCTGYLLSEFIHNRPSIDSTIKYYG